MEFIPRPACLLPVIQWLLDHPKFMSNELYVGGDSYSGFIVPIIVQEIYNGNL
jgi:serine carboxypeptidase-like clade 1